MTDPMGSAELLDALYALADDDADPADVPLLDVGGYLACGCHGSQRDHTCTPD